MVPMFFCCDASLEKSGPGEEWDDVDTTFFDGLPAAFFAVDQNDAEFHVASFPLNGVDGFQCGSTCCDHVINNDDVLTGGEVSFDLFSRAMAFGLFTDGVNLESFVGMLAGGGHADRE